MEQWVTEIRGRLTAEFAQRPAVCVMATVDLNGRPTARCMICCEIDHTGHLLFVSDRRTGKDDHLRACPDTEICFWLSTTQTQVRVRGVATVVDAEADTFMREKWWDQLPRENRDIFTSAINHEGQIPPMPQTFELIVVDASEVEVQELNTRPHKKQLWKDTGGRWESSVV
ncbi:MAG: pyridoxamine 5'-phosphate oxidase family protein [Burkholderiales bacterium]|nr:pyridoxamine 5'-phosphate oxidase family protein [Phycisphaerae bacterium]